jgi:hypothetical protein
MSPLSPLVTTYVTTCKYMNYMYVTTVTSTYGSRAHETKFIYKDPRFLVVTLVTGDAAAAPDFSVKVTYE